MSEVWRPVLRAEGAYEVSSTGRVRSVERLVRAVWKNGAKGQRRASGRILRPTFNPKGYAQYNIHRRTRLGHHLVLEAFVGPRPAGLECRHLNGVRNDNRVENLAWGTAQQNADDVAAHGSRRFGETNPASRLSDADVVEIRQLAGKIPMAELAARYGCSRQHIGKIQSGKRRALN